MNKLKQDILWRYCAVHDDIVKTTEQWFCKSCGKLICDECYQDRRIHECILDG